jgi:hypothetical protein
MEQMPSRISVRQGLWERTPYAQLRARHRRRVGEQARNTQLLHGMTALNKLNARREITVL